MARKFRKHLGYPRYKRYFKLLETNYFRNCPITVDDAKRALHIYGPDKESLKGKSRRRKPDKIMDGIMIDIPDTIKDLHPNAHLSAGYLFVQGIAFLHSISRGYSYRTVEYNKSYSKKYKKADMAKEIKKCINLYHKRGLNIIKLNTDNEFSCIEDDILPVELKLYYRSLFRPLASRCSCDDN